MSPGLRPCPGPGDTVGRCIADSLITPGRICRYCADHKRAKTSRDRTRKRNRANSEQEQGNG